METEEQQADFHVEEEVNIYDDLCGFDLGDEVEKLKTENRRLEQLIRTLQSDIDKLNSTVSELKETQKNLTKNISALFVTAKAEIERKDRMIEELRAQIDNRRLSKHNPEYNKRKDRDNSPLELTRIKKFKTDDQPVKADSLDVDRHGSKCNDTIQESRSVHSSERPKYVECDNRQQPSKYSEERYSDRQFVDIRYESRTRYPSDRYNESEKYDSRSKYDKRSNYEDDGYYSRSKYPYDRYNHRQGRHDYDNRYDHRWDPHANVRRETSGNRGNRNFDDRTVRDRDEYREESEKHSKYSDRLIDNYNSDYYRDDQKFPEKSHRPMPDLAPTRGIGHNTSNNIQEETICKVGNSPTNSRGVTPMPLPEDIEIPKEKPKKRLKMLEKMEKKVKNKLSQISNNSSDQCDSPTAKIVNKSIDLVQTLRDSESEKSSVTSNKSTVSNKSEKCQDFSKDRISQTNMDRLTDLTNEKTKSKGNVNKKIKSSQIAKNTSILSKNDETLKKVKKDKNTEKSVNQQDINTQLSMEKIHSTPDTKNTPEVPPINKSKPEVSTNITEKFTMKQMRKELQKTKQQKKDCDGNKHSAKGDKNRENKVVDTLRDSKQDAIWQNLNKLFGEDEDDLIENISEKPKSLSKKGIKPTSQEDTHREETSYNKFEEKINNIAEQDDGKKLTGDKSTNNRNIIPEECSKPSKSENKIGELNINKEKSKSKSKCEKPVNLEKCIKGNERPEFSKRDIKNQEKVADEVVHKKSVDSTKEKSVKNENIGETTGKEDLQEKVSKQSSVKDKPCKQNKPEEKNEKKSSEVSVEEQNVIQEKTKLESSHEQDIEQKQSVKPILLKETIETGCGKGAVTNKNILEIEEKPNNEEFIIENCKTNELDENIVKSDAVKIKNVHVLLEDITKSGIKKPVEDELTTVECHLKDKRRSRENSKEKCIPSSFIAENVVGGRRSERIMRQREKRCSIDSVPDSEKEDKKQMEIENSKNNKQKNEKETNEPCKDSIIKSITQVGCLKDKKKDKRESDEILKQFEHDSNLNQNLIKPNEGEDINKQGGLNKDVSVAKPEEKAESSKKSSEDFKRKRRKSTLIVVEQSSSIESKIESSSHLIKQNMNESSDDVTTNKKSRNQKLVESEEIDQRNATDGIKQQSQKENKKDTESNSPKKNDENNTREIKTVQFETGQRNRVREVKRKIRFPSTEDTSDQDINTKLHIKNISNKVSMRKNIETVLKIEESTSKITKDGECSKKIIEHPKIEYLSNQDQDNLITSSLADKSNKNDPEKNEKQTSINTKKGISKHSSPKDNADLSIFSQSEAEQSFDISLNSLKTVDKLIEINDVVHVKSKEAESIPSSDSSTSEDMVVVCEPDKKNIIDNKLDKLLEQYMDNFTVDDVATTSEKPTDNTVVAATPMEQNTVAESDRKHAEIFPQTNPVITPPEPKIKILKVVAITSSSYSIENHTPNGIENIVIDRTVTSNFNTSTTSSLDSQKVASDVANPKKKRRITPTPVVEDKPQCSFENILTNTCQRDGFTATVPMIESPLHLTHEGEIPVLHLEENQLNSLPTEVNVNDKNIMNLLECMNISNIDCDTTKFKNITVTNDTAVNSAVGSDANGLSFENIIDKVISKPVSSIKDREGIVNIPGNVNSVGSMSSSNSNVGQTVSSSIQPGTVPFPRRRRRCRLVIRD